MIGGEMEPLANMEDFLTVQIGNKTEIHQFLPNQKIKSF